MADFPIPDPPFSFEELDNSVPFNPSRRFAYRKGTLLVDQTVAAITTGEQRCRKRKPADDQRLRRTVEVMLANLLAASRNVLDDSRFLAVSFNRNDYVETGLSHISIRQCHTHLLETGMVEGSPGFRRFDADGVGVFGRRTRVRATPALRDVFDNADLGARSATIVGLLRLKKRTTTATPPNDVASSEALLANVNARLLHSDIGISATVLDQWRRAAVSKGEEARYSGDLLATALYRVFNGDWKHGGRIYGGWWQSVPKELRAHIHIDGQPTVELDYKTLHPTLLFARSGRTLDFDPYVIPGLHGDRLRTLSKQTFNRLLNGTAQDGRPAYRLRALPGDKAALPAKLSFAAYLDLLLEHLRPLQEWFGTGEGVRLQREDSDLVIGILTRLYDAGVVALPIHDSFVVAACHSGILRETMINVFRDRYGIVPGISEAKL